MMEDDQEPQGCTASWPDAEHQVRAFVLLCLLGVVLRCDATEQLLGIQFVQPKLKVTVLQHMGEPYLSDYKHKADCVGKGFFLYVITNSVALVREQTIPTERPPPVGQVSANFCG
jgi:hypothetical protein